MTENKTEARKLKVLGLMEDPSYVPMREKELACIMLVEPEDRPEFKRILQELLSEGKILLNGKSGDIAADPVARKFYLGENFSL